MPVTVLLTCNVKSENLDELQGALGQLLPDTRAYEGFIQIDILQNDENPSYVVFHEIWETKEHYMAYLKWRTDTGVMDKLASMLSEPAKIEFFERWDV